MILKKLIFKLLLFLLISLSILSVFININKSFSEFKTWGHLTDFEKRNKIFGDTYDYLLFIDKNSNNENKVLIYSEDIQAPQLARYYLYPVLVDVVEDKEELIINSRNKEYNLLFSFNYKPKIKDFEFVKSEKLTNKKEAFFYRRK